MPGFMYQLVFPIIIISLPPFDRRFEISVVWSAVRSLAVTLPTLVAGSRGFCAARRLRPVWAIRRHCVRDFYSGSRNVSVCFSCTLEVRFGSCHFTAVVGVRVPPTRLAVFPFASNVIRPVAIACVFDDRPRATFYSVTLVRWFWASVTANARDTFGVLYASRLWRVQSVTTPPLPPRKEIHRAFGLVVGGQVDRSTVVRRRPRFRCRSVRVHP